MALGTKTPNAEFDLPPFAIGFGLSELIARDDARRRCFQRHAAASRAAAISSTSSGRDLYASAAGPIEEPRELERVVGLVIAVQHFDREGVGCGELRVCGRTSVFAVQIVDALCFVGWRGHFGAPFHMLAADHQDEGGEGDFMARCTVKTRISTRAWLIGRFEMRNPRRGSRSQPRYLYA